jgi:hypothetical protein
MYRRGAGIARPDAMVRDRNHNGSALRLDKITGLGKGAQMPCMVVPQVSMPATEWGRVLSIFLPRRIQFQGPRGRKFWGTSNDEQGSVNGFRLVIAVAINWLRDRDAGRQAGV